MNSNEIIKRLLDENREKQKRADLMRELHHVLEKNNVTRSEIPGIIKKIKEEMFISV